MRKKKKEPKATYHISDVSRMYNLHPQTLRLYEREGLLTPSRSLRKKRRRSQIFQQRDG